MTEGIAVSGQSFAVHASGRTVLFSGSVQTFSPEDGIDFRVEDLVFRVRFYADKGSRRVEGASNGKEAEIKLYNFDNVLGTGTKEPMEVGKLRGKKLWLTFLVYTLDDKTVRTIHYTFFLED